MAERYCETADLYDFGLPRGAVRNPGRRAGTVSVVANTIELEGHGYSNDTVLAFRAEAGGTMAAPLVEGTQYYAIVVDDDHFSVAAAAGGAAIDITNAGSRLVVIHKLPIQSAIEYASEVVLDMLPAHVVPLTAPYPRIISMTVAEIAAAKLGFYSGGKSTGMADTLDAAQKRVARWATGVPIRGANAPAAASLSSAMIPRDDSGGWSRYGGIS